MADALVCLFIITLSPWLLISAAAIVLLLHPLFAIVSFMSPFASFSNQVPPNWIPNPKPYRRNEFLRRFLPMTHDSATTFQAFFASVFYDFKPWLCSLFKSPNYLKLRTDTAYILSYKVPIYKNFRLIKPSRHKVLGYPAHFMLLSTIMLHPEARHRHGWVRLRSLADFTSGPCHYKFYRRGI
jgi:hypothetical protein